MPRESSKCKSWEKERRERLNKSFEELAKVLPSYDPSINKSKNDILKQAQQTITELKEEIHLLTSSNEENKTFKDKQVKKLQERIKKLLIRNEQLTSLFKNAGIKPPTVVGTVKRFRKKGIWSNRFPQQSKDLQKKETEKENVSADNSRMKPKRTKLVSTNQVKSSKIGKAPSKIQKLKKLNKKVSLTHNLLLLSQIPTVPAINQQLVFVPNTPVHNLSRGPSLLTVQTSKPVKSTKPKALNPINLNLRSSSLGPGTLILGNGNIISLLPQPQLMIPPLTMPSQTVVFSKVINNSKSNKKTFIQSNSCITKTTQINKVPIPALTSRYANTSLLLNHSVKSAKKTNKKQVIVVKEDMVKSTKRKANDECKMEPKKSKTEVKINNEINKSHENTETLISEAAINKENTSEKEKILPIEIKTTDSTVITSCSNISNENTVNDFKNTESSTQREITDKNHEKGTEANQILEKTESINISVPNNNQTSEKSIESASTITTSCNPSKEAEVSNKTSKTETSSAVSSTSSVTSTLSVSVHEDAMKNIDLNLVHSDLSNDIFASLQVPPGCQNAESTSPTAAFLLAFPLVSSIKVTEVIDEENSDSQRETPTLLQIGNMDTSKQSHTDNLLNLDNFPFFNSKDICGSYYNSKLDTNSNNKNAGMTSAQNSKLENQSFDIYVDNNTSTKEVPPNTDFKVSYEIFSKDNSHILESKNNANKPSQKLNEAQNHTQNSKLDNQSFDIYVGNNTSTKEVPPNTDFKVSYEIFSKDNSHILESKNNANKPQKLNEAQNHINSVVNNQQYVLYEDKRKHTPTKDVPPNNDFKVSYEIFSKDNSHILESKSNPNKPQKLNEAHNHINSVLNNQQYALYEEKSKNTLTKDVIPPNTNFKVSYELFSKSDSHILGSKTNANKSQKLNETQNHSNHINSVLSNQQYVLYEEKQQNMADTKFKNFQHKSENQLVQIVQEKKVSNSASYTETDNVLTSNINTNFNLPLISSKYNLSDNNVYKNNYSEKDVQIQMNKQLDNEENTANQMEYIFKSSSNNKDINNEFNSNNKIITNPQKQLTTFSLNSVKDITNQNIENCNNKSNNKPNDNTFHYNPFEPVKTSKETSLNIVDNNCSKPANNIVNKDKVCDVPKKINEVCPKSMDTTPCYFSSNYSSTPGYKSDFSKPCPPCTYDNQRNYSNPFYTNCNYSYNYSDTNINQNYYKPDTKSCYSLNYENYQEYRKTDTTFNNIPRDGKNNMPKEKPVIQNKTVNWMTEQKSQTSDCFLPSFTNQSYSFTSCISSDTNDVNPSDIKKTERFSWSPTKLPNFLEPQHNFITPTLPTLVGDLALGNSLTVDAKNDYKYLKEPKRKTTYDNQVNFLSVSQLVNQNKTDNSPARTTTRRLSGSKSKSITPTKNKRFDKNIDKGTVKPINNNFDIFYEQKNRSANKNVLSSYSAEALIGNQNIQENKKCTDNAAKPICSSNFLTENIVPYFTTVDDGYMNQNQNFHNTYTHNSFQNNSYTGNNFIYTTPSITSSYLSSNFDSTHDYSTDNVMNYKNCGNKNYRITNKEDKNVIYPSNIKKSKKGNQTNNTLGNFEYPLLPIQGSTNSPILPDDYQSHATFLPPTAPYPCKNSLYQKQGNEFNAGPLLPPLPGISRNNIQHPQVSPSLNNAGTSLTNFNLSTIFPEINKGQIPNALSTSNKSKSNSTYLEGSFNADPKYNFSG